MDNNITLMVQFENPKEVTTIASLSPRNNNTELLDISEFRRILTKDNELTSSMFSEDLALNNISEEPKPKKKRSLFRVALA